MPLAGHLHVYIFSAQEKLIAERKHQVTGLDSMRQGHILVPFNILLENVPPEINRVFLEYHGSGHPEG